MFKSIKNKITDLELNDNICTSEIESLKQDVKELERRVYINKNPFKVELHTKVYGISKFGFALFVVLGKCLSKRMRRRGLCY